MLEIVWSNQFKRDYRKLKKQGADLNALEGVIDQLANQQPLDRRHMDHALRGNWLGYRECHVRPDLLLIYRVEANELRLARTGSHTELFRK